MANKRITENVRRAVNVARRSGSNGGITIVEVPSADGSDAGQPGTIANADRSANTDDRNLDNEPIEPVANGAGSGIPIVECDPAELGDRIAASRDADSGSGSGTGRRPGRKPRGPNKRRKETPQNIDTALLLLHTMAASVLHTPELMLSDEEAKQLSDAYVEFSRHHEVGILSEKRMSEVMLISAVCMMYGPRLMAVRMRKKEEKKDRPFNVRGSQPVSAIHPVM